MVKNNLISTHFRNRICMGSMANTITHRIRVPMELNFFLKYVTYYYWKEVKNSWFFTCFKNVIDVRRKNFSVVVRYVPVKYFL